MAIEPVAGDTQSKHVQTHVRDYSRFLKMLKYGAIVSFVTGLVVVLIIAN